MTFIPDAEQKPKRLRRRAYKPLQIHQPALSSYALPIEQEDGDETLRVLKRIARLLDREYIDQHHAISDTQSTLFLDYKGRKHLYLFSPSTITLNLHDIGTLAVSANTWTDISFRETLQVFTSGQATPVFVLVRATDDLIVQSSSIPNPLPVTVGNFPALQNVNMSQVGGVATAMATTDTVAGSQIPEICVGIVDNTGAISRLHSAGFFTGDGTPLGFTIAVGSFLSNKSGTNQWDRQHNNLDTVNVISATLVSATQTSADITSYNARGVNVFLNVTAIGTGSLVVTVNNKDTNSGNYVTIFTSAAVNANGETLYQIYPGLSGAGNARIGRTFQIVVTGANNSTFFVNEALLI